MGARFQFGSFELDVRAGELRKKGLRIHLEDQPFRVLSMLVSREGGVVTREELKEALWDDRTHVDFDRGLTRAVNKVRLAIGDSASNPHFLETIPRRGYRFVAPVTVLEPESKSPTEPVEVHEVGTERFGRRQLWPWAFGSAAALVGTLPWLGPWKGRRKPISSVAVLPFESVPSDPEHRYFSDGMTDQLTQVMSRLPELRVISFKSAMPYRGTSKKLEEIAEELKVEALVDGSVAQSADRVRINARLVAFPGGQTVWASSFERAATEVFSVQSELARAIASEIGRGIRPEDERRLAHSARPVDPQLHDLYLQGRFYSNQPSREALERSIAILERVVAQDPSHAPAYSAMSDAWFGMASIFMPPVVAMPKAKAAARKAIELDPRSDSARALLGRIHVFYDWDYPAAEEQMRSALELNPNCSEAHRGWGLLKLATGHDKEALAAMEKAVKLDPRSFWANCQFVLIALFTKQHDYAIRHAKATLQWAPDFGLLRSFLGMTYLETGQIPEAIKELETAVQHQRVPTTIGFLATGYARAGRAPEAAKAVQQLVELSRSQYVCPFEVGAAYAALGRLDDAFAWMDRGVGDRADCMIFLRTEPWLRQLRQDPRYPELERRIGFA